MTRAFALFILAFCLAALPAQAAKKQPPASKSEQQKQMEEANAAALADAKVNSNNYKQAVCIVSGHVKTMERVEVSPWSNGAPTTLTTTEVRILLTPESRKPQNAQVSAEDCPLPVTTKGMIYKLCSPTVIKEGDRIMGTEGLATGTDSVLGCLFDVAVIPKGVPVPDELPAVAPPPVPKDAP